MYTPIYLLPQFNAKDREKYEDRWRIPENQHIRDAVLEVIRSGGGEDCLSYIYEEYENFFEDMWDLKGIDLLCEEINFPKNDNFEAIDFSYAYFGGLKFGNATFHNSIIQFVNMDGCEFSNCIFAFGSFYGTTLANTKFIECDFVDIRMTNCGFENVEFVNCFAPKRLFFECKFNQSTTINLSKEPYRLNTSNINNQDLAEIYKGIKESYLAGGVIEKSRDYLYKQQQSITRFNSKTFSLKLKGYFLEYLAGYGTKPLRVLYIMLFVYLFFTVVFSLNTNWSDGYLLSAGAFFTFGAKTNLLDEAGVIYKALYIVESFLGLSLIALFITVLINYWFQER